MRGQYLTDSTGAGLKQGGRLSQGTNGQWQPAQPSGQRHADILSALLTKRSQPVSDAHTPASSKPLTGKWPLIVQHFELALAAVGVSEPDFASMIGCQSRTPVAVRARVWKWMHQTPIAASGEPPSLTEIGAVTGGYDHSVVSHAINGGRKKKRVDKTSPATTR